MRSGLFRCLMASVILTLGLSHASAVGVVPVGDPVLDPPTVQCLGLYWILRDAGGGTAHVAVEYRPKGSRAWRQAAPLFQARRGPFKDEGGVVKKVVLEIPADAHMYAGSILMLDPGTAYEIRLTVAGDNGVNIVRTLETQTMSEPIAPAGMIERHVVPGNGGGTGTRADPFRGLKAATHEARPGDLFLLHAGTYDAPFYVNRSGEPGKPIIWRGGVDGESIIDMHLPLDKLSGAVIEASDLHDVWFEKLSIRNAYNAVRAHEAYSMVVRRCHISNVVCGIVAQKDDTDHIRNLFISDNVIEGIMPWPCTEKQWHDLPESRAVWITGRGNIACYNYIHNFKDGLDVDDCLSCVSNDFYNNDVRQMFDDGSEMDGSDRNTRNFLNRYVNVLCGVSFQPVYGGPVYAVRNVIYNVRNEPFKLHNSPAGAVIVHNTSVRNGDPLRVSTSDPYYNCYSRNNLLVGTGGRAYDCTPATIDCDYDYDGFAGWSGEVFFKWNNVKYATPEEVRSKSPVEKHIIVPDAASLFASGLQAPANELTVYDATKIDVRLKAGSGAVGAGVYLPGFDDPGAGASPDLGAYPAGSLLPHYGPRPERQ